MINQSILRWAKETPDKAAIICDGEALSYLDFHRFIARIRKVLIHRGCVGEGYAIVATVNSMRFWIVSLALRSLGYTTISVTEAAMLDTISLDGISILVAFVDNHWDQLDNFCANKSIGLVRLDLGSDEFNVQPSRNIVIPRYGGHLLRTSGTTGNYKFVLMTPEADAVFLRRKNEIMDMNQETVLGLFNFPPWTAAGYRWAASVWRVGGTLVIVQKDALQQVLCHSGLTHAVMVPTTLEKVLAAPVDSFPYNKNLRLTVGGGAMTQRQIGQVLARITPHLFNLLASTEGGVIAHTPIRTGADMESHLLVADRLVEVVDENNEPVNQGEIGRIRVFQGELVRSYLNNPEDTAKCFQDGYFYPGDLASVQSDGRLALQGRVSDILNIGGFKIPPIHIEQQLAQHAGVPVCLFANRLPLGQEELHIVFETDVKFNRDEIDSVLGDIVKYIADVKLHSLSRFPRTELGKVIRHELFKKISTL